MRKLQAYIAAKGITAETLGGPDKGRDEDGWQHYAYVVRLRNDDQDTGMEIPWRVGLDVTTDPEDSVESIMSCLISDAWGAESARSFEDWAGDYGYDPDSRKAERLYRACQKSADDLIDFLGGRPELEKLALEYERL